jgi:hypothetical protein
VSVFNVGFVIFPDLTQLDFTGPQQVLARLPDSAMHIVAKTLDPVPSDSGLSLMPDRIRAAAGSDGEIRHLRLHRSLYSRRRRAAERPPRDNTLGLRRVAASDRRDA